MKIKNVAAVSCIGLSLNFFVPKPANAIDPFSIIFWIGVGAYTHHEMNKDKPVPKPEPELKSSDSEVEDESDYIVTFDDQLQRRPGNSQVIRVSEGVVQDYGTNVSQSFEISFDKNERDNIGGNIGLAKMERAITKNYSRSFGQNITTSQKVSLDGSFCEEYLVKKTINYRTGKVVIDHDDSEIDFEIIESIDLKADDLCTPQS